MAQIVDAQYPKLIVQPGQIFLADKLTPFTDLELCIGMVAAYPVEFGEEILRPQLCALAGQVILECGHGQHCHNFEIGNKKAGPGYQGWIQYFRCNEIISGKLKWFDPYNPGCCFRGWDRLPPSIQAQLRFLGKATTGTGKPNRYARAWAAARAGDWAGYSWELSAAGYYTASRDLYTKGLVQLAGHLDATLPADILVISVPHVTDPAVLQPTQGHSPFSNADLSRILSLQLPLTIDWDALRDEQKALSLQEDLG
jgi:hypothetical protein